MSAGPVVVTAVFRPRPGARAQLIEAMRRGIEAVHAEPGCEVYAIHDADDGTVTMIEKWSGVAELDAHAAGEAIAVLNHDIEPFLASPVVVTRMMPLPMGTAAGRL